PRREVDVGLGAADHPPPDVHHRVAGLAARLQPLLDPRLDGGDELGRDRSALDRVDEVESLARGRLDVDHRVAVLAAAAGLADEAALDLVDAVADRLPVRDLGTPDVRVNGELA